MTVAILCYFFGRRLRGAENWAQAVKDHTLSPVQVDIYGGWTTLAFWRWWRSDVIVPVDGRGQVGLCRILTWLAGKPMVVFGHSGPGADDKWNLLCCPDIFVVFSQSQRRWARRFKLPWTAVEVIPHAVDVSRFTPARRKPHRNVVLCVGARTTRHKRVELVESAVKQVASARLILVGEGNPLRASAAEMPRLYRQADIFCLVPQPWEAFGLVFLEALACNLPVVTTDDPVRREIVGEAGVYIKEPMSPAAVAAGIRSALTADWGNWPRRQAQKFAWEVIGPMYQKLWHKVLGRSRI